MDIKKVMALVLSGVMLIPQSVMAEETTDNAEYRYFEIMSNYAANLYIDDSVTTEEIMRAGIENAVKDNPELMYELIKSAYASLDEYTEFYTAEEYEDFYNSLNSTLYGIGVIIQKQNDYVTVLRCYEDGAAAGVGILPEDKIIGIDGVNAVGMSIDEAQSLIRGDLGTEVKLTVLRDSKELEFTMVRGEITVETVYSEVLADNIGYIEIASFSAETAAEFSKAISELKASGVKKVILDLRNNPGGYLEAVIEIAEMVVPEGLIAQSVYRQEENNQNYYSTLAEAPFEFAVLVNTETASAAEILTGALQDSGVGYIVGEITYGKGVIQEIFTLPTGGAFKITTGYYLTRNGRYIDGDGISPDEYVENRIQQIDISKYSTFAYEFKPSVGVTHQNVRAAKERLSVMGYYFGEINDYFDEDLAVAVENFQRANDLFPYGVLDTSTQVKLENVFYKLDVVVDEQMIFAYEYLGGNADNL